MIYVANIAYRGIFSYYNSLVKIADLQGTLLVLALPRKATQRHCEEVSFREQTSIAALAFTSDEVLVQVEQSCCPATVGVFLVRSFG